MRNRKKEYDYPETLEVLRFPRKGLFSLGLHQFTKSMVIYCLFIIFNSGTDFIQVCSSAEFTVWFTAPGSIHHTSQDKN